MDLSIDDSDTPTEPGSLTKAMSDDFRSFVEWILEIDLTPQQEERMHQMLQEEWDENDRETIELVQGSLATYRMVRGTNPEFQARWRSENRKSFIAALRDDGEALGQSLLNAYAAEHSPEAQFAQAASAAGASQAGTTWKSALGVFGAILGGVALAALEERATRAQQAREQLARDRENVEAAINSVGDSVQVRDFDPAFFQQQMRTMEDIGKITSNIFGDHRWEYRY